MSRFLFLFFLGILTLPVAVCAEEARFDFYYTANSYGEIRPCPV